jgi:glyceraldehyde-3-phosphate dehydrogenase (ferredoxin)
VAWGATSTASTGWPAKDLEATLKYRFDPKFGTGGTFGANFATLGGRMLAFNYRSIYMSEAERLELHERFIVNHYLKQFNSETIETKSQRTCGEPCSAACKKMRGEYKKDYEPYQTLGPLCGIFDQRAVELLNHPADALGFDAISAGGVLAWLMECLAEGHLSPADLGVSERPVFQLEGFSVESDSMHNARLGVALLDAIIAHRGVLDLSEGARKLARHLARERGTRVLDPFLYTAFARKGWMVPNQYWTPGVLSPMAIMGKYYMHYEADFLSPRELGRRSAQRLRAEMILDDLGMCRFRRKWAEEMLPEVMDSLWGMRERFLAHIDRTASRINSRNASVYWESRRNIDFVHRFLERRREVDGDPSPELLSWLERFRRDPGEAALGFWFETLKGIHESLREF